MKPADVSMISDADIVELLVDLKPADEAVAWLASVIADPAKVAGVNELSRRYLSESNGDGPGTIERVRHPHATSIKIDPVAFKAFFFRRRIPLTEVGPIFGRSRGWASVTASKQRMGFWAADELATELEMHVEDFLAQVCAPEERARLSA